MGQIEPVADFSGVAQPRGDQESVQQGHFHLWHQSDSQKPCKPQSDKRVADSGALLRKDKPTQYGSHQARGKKEEG